MILYDDDIHGPVSLPLLCEATSSTLLLSDTASGSRDDAAYEDETNNKDKTTATKKSNDGTAVDFIAPLKTRALRSGRSSRHFSTAKRQLLLLLLGAPRCRLAATHCVTLVSRPPSFASGRHRPVSAVFTRATFCRRAVTVCPSVCLNG